MILSPFPRDEWPQLRIKVMKILLLKPPEVIITNKRIIESDIGGERASRQTFQLGIATQMVGRLFKFNFRTRRRFQIHDLR